MRTAIVHDWLVSYAGAERVLEEIYKLFPSPVYALVHCKEALKESPLSQAKVYTSFIQKLPRSTKWYRYYLPLFPMAIEDFDLSHYDLIISSSHAVAKGVLRNAKQVHICYCHTPMRYAWDLYYQYLGSSNLSKGMKGFFAKLFLHYIRLWDYSSSQRVDYFVANSNPVADRIRKVYGRHAEVIHPPVDVDHFDISTDREDYYITVSRLVPYKRVDLIIKAFSMQKWRKLLIVGDGPEYKKLKEIASKNIEFLGSLKNDELKKYLMKAKAFVYMGEEDFGIAMVEAQACGIPVIAYGFGGARDIVQDGKTGILFYEQSEDAFLGALDHFEKKQEGFLPEKIRENAKRFSKEAFREKFKTFVDRVVNETI
ncbi:MAG: glycosyltransferase family 4 protein [Aquificaceae bacterium]